MSTIDTEPLTDAVAVLTLAGEALTTAAWEANISALSWEDAVRLIDRLRDTARVLARVDSDLTRHVYLTAPHGDTEVEGIGRVGIKRSVDRKDWDSRGAVFDYVEHKLASAEGEIPEPGVVASWVLEVCGVNYIRVTPLRALGLDPQEYCTQIPGKPQIVLPPTN